MNLDAEIDEVVRRLAQADIERARHFESCDKCEGPKRCTDGLWYDSRYARLAESHARKVALARDEFAQEVALPDRSSPKCSKGRCRLPDGHEGSCLPGRL